MEEEITITRGSLIAALRKWDEDAKGENWPERTDDQRFADSADYLLDAMKADRGA